MKAPYVYRNQMIVRAIAAYDVFGNLFLRKKAPRATESPKHICLIILHQIGDMVMCLPSIAAVREMYPEAKISVIAGKGPAQLLVDNTWKAEVHTFEAMWQHVVRQIAGYEKDKSKIAASKKGFLKLLESLNPDTLLIFHPDLRVNQIVGQTNIPHTIGFVNAGGGFCLTHPLVMPETGHQVERNFYLVQTLGSVFGTQVPKLAPPQFSPLESDKEAVNQLLREEKLKADKLVVLHPFGSAETKNWLPEYWADVMRWIVKERYTPVMVGGPKDTLPLPSDIAPHVVNFCGKVNLMQTAALLSQSRLFIGVDSGPAHIAAATGCPTISIFSSVNEVERWHPYGTKDKTVILHKEVTDRATFPYELRDLPEGVKGNPYIDRIKPADVITAGIKLLSV